MEITDAQRDGKAPLHTFGALKALFDAKHGEPPAVEPPPAKGKRPKGKRSEGDAPPPESRDAAPPADAPSARAPGEIVAEDSRSTPPEAPHADGPSTDATPAAPDGE